MRDKLTIGRFALLVVVFTTVVSVVALVAARSGSAIDEAIVRFLSGVAPVRAVSFNIGAKAFAFDKPFTTNEEWLSEFSVNMENFSSKKVTYVDFGIFVLKPKGHDDKFPFHFNIIKGHRQAALERRDSGLLYAPSNTPEGILSIGSSQKERAAIRVSLDHLGFPRLVKEVHVQVEEVVFEDGTI